jgi:pimeloyl-ACP methyl ester carboxylesterase
MDPTRPIQDTHFDLSGVASTQLVSDDLGRDLQLSFQSVKGPKGIIKTISAFPEKELDCPTLYFLPGWWGSASDYIPVFKFFASFGFKCRSLSFRGTGGSDGWTFWGLGLQRDLVPVLEFFNDSRMVLIPHSGAIDPVRHALPVLAQKSLISRIEGIIVIAPLARSGAFPALLRFLKPDNTGTTIQRWARFLGSNLLGLTWFMRNSLAIRRVLLSDYCSEECVRQVRSQIDTCAFGRYVLSLARTFFQYPDLPFSTFGIPHTLLIHTDLDRNFSTPQQRDTAKAIGAEFIVLEKTCHQWFAEPFTFKLAREAMLSWLKEKELLTAEPSAPLALS